MFGKRLRAARMARKLTQQEAADCLGVQLRTYQKYEQGVRDPAFELLVTAADALGVPTDFLLGRDEYLKRLEVTVDVPETNPPVRPKPNSRQ